MTKLFIFVFPTVCIEFQQSKEYKSNCFQLLVFALVFKTLNSNNSMDISVIAYIFWFHSGMKRMIHGVESSALRRQGAVAYTSDPEIVRA